MTTPNPFLALTESEIAALPSPPEQVVATARRIYMLLAGCCYEPQPVTVPATVADDDLLLAWPPFPVRPAPRLIASCGDMNRLADDVAGGAR